MHWYVTSGKVEEDSSWPTPEDTWIICMWKLSWSSLNIEEIVQTHLAPGHHPTWRERVWLMWWIWNTSGTETGTICSGTSGVQNWEIKEKWCFNLPQQVNKQWIHCLIVWTLFTNISLWVLLTADMMKLPSWSSWSLFFTRFSIRVFSKFMSLMSLVCSRQQDWGPKHSGTTGQRTGLQTSK